MCFVFLSCDGDFSDVCVSRFLFSEPRLSSAIRRIRVIGSFSSGPMRRTFKCRALIDRQKKPENNIRSMEIIHNYFVKCTRCRNADTIIIPGRLGRRLMHRHNFLSHFEFKYHEYFKSVFSACNHTPRIARGEILLKGGSETLHRKVSRGTSLIFSAPPTFEYSASISPCWASSIREFAWEGFRGPS